MRLCYRYTAYFLLTFFIGAVPATLHAQNTSSAADTAYLEWPQEFVVPAGRIVMYQLQLESFNGNVLQARAAVSVTEKDSIVPVFGAVWFTCRVSTDTDARTVTLENVSITSARFPDMAGEKINKLSRLLESEIPRMNIVISLDRILTGLELVEQRQALSENLNNKPPEIIFITRPAVLVLIDGDPVLQDIEKSDLQYVVNTPFLIVYQPSSQQYYLRGGDYWYTSAAVLKSWRETTEVPEEIARLAKPAQPETTGTVVDTAQNGEPVIPEILVHTKPAELIQSDGEPEYSPVEGTGLLYLKNSENDVLLQIETQEYYVLISGRWYKSGSLAGDSWTFVPPDKMPADFGRIPENSEMGNVLASVAGTEEAREAVLENSIPQTAVVDRKEATLTVEYDGNPEFKKIEGTSMSYAVNTAKSVLLIENRYYCCDDAVWFEADNPKGPWRVSTKVPDQVQEIPPESPVYNVKYVYIYDSTPDVVYVGYTPGYYGSYVYGGCVVYGTGWWYHPWYHHYYYPRPVTWGFGVHYNPWSGWGFSFGVSYGWLNIGFSTWRPPYYGYWGPAHYRAGYRHGYYHGYNRGYYEGLGAGHHVEQRNPDRNIYKRRENGVRHTATQRPQTTAARPADRGTNNQLNNVYTDRNGDVFRRDENGKWQKRENGKWQKSDQADRAGAAKARDVPKTSGESASQRQLKSGSDRSGAQSGSSASPSLNREYQSRQRGSERTTQFRSARTAGGRSHGGGRRR